MTINLLNTTHNLKPLESLLFRNGKYVAVSYEELKAFPQEAISLFCHKYALYQIPTTELIDFLKNEIQDEPTIEIGAGNGCIGRSLGIKMVDNYQQTWPEIMKAYFLMGQPLIKYGEDVEEIAGNEAVRKYKPKNVIGCWLTQKWEGGMKDGNFWGVDELQMFYDGIEKYIIVGNEKTHKSKKLFAYKKSKEYKFDWLLSRSMSKEDNVIYIFK